MKYDFHVSQLRVVTIFLHKDGKVSEHRQRHMMHESQVETFVKATINLHHKFGNPHTGYKLDNLWEIRLSQVEVETQSYWWCVPDLQRNGDPKGAQLNQEIEDRRIWANPLLLEQEEEYRRELERQEWLADFE